MSYKSTIKKDFSFGLFISVFDLLKGWVS